MCIRDSALRGLRTDLVVANRVLPEASPDTWLAGPVAQQRKTLEEWREVCAVRTVAHLGRDPRGTDDLTALAVPGPDADAPAVEWPVLDRLGTDGVLVWHIPLPGAIRDELDLVRRGDELAVTAGRFRRIVPLPSALRRCTVDGAACARTYCASASHPTRSSGRGACETRRRTPRNARPRAVNPVRPFG